MSSTQNTTTENTNTAPKFDPVAFLKENGVRIWPEEIKEIAAKIHSAIPTSNLSEWDEKAEAHVSPYSPEQIEAATFRWFDQLVDDLKYDAVSLFLRGDGRFEEALREVTR